MGRYSKVYTSYMDPPLYRRLRKVSDTLRIPASEIVRAGIKLALDELEAGRWLWEDDGSRRRRNANHGKDTREVLEKATPGSDEGT